MKRARSGVDPDDFMGSPRSGQQTDRNHTLRATVGQRHWHQWRHRRVRRRRRRAQRRAKVVIARNVPYRFRELCSGYRRLDRRLGQRHLGWARDQSIGKYGPLARVVVDRCPEALRR
jgi:hypothetical protein